jgi:L-threonylcarbamoyladenylate synthase
MASLYDCAVDAELLTGMRLARASIARGELVVVPTDTVYGIAADAFDSAAVQRLLEAKGRTRQSPPPVLVKGQDTLAALTESVPDLVRPLLDEFWPGGLTVILRAQASLAWDLGETRGTVALRMPSNRLVLELLEETGPLAVSSANLTGQPAAVTAQEALDMLGDSVAVYLDGGVVGSDYERRPGANSGSTIVDATASDDGVLRIVRHGVISDDDIRRVAGSDVVV